MHHYIVHLLDTYGYWGLFGALTLEYLFFPVPGETTLVTSGILWRQGSYHLSLIGLIVATSLGTFTGSLFGYAVGRILGRPVVERFGRYVRVTPARIDHAEALFKQYTVPTLLISRYIAFVRVIVPYLAGINRIRLWVYIPIMLLGSFLWTSTFIFAGGLIEHAWHTVMLHWRTDLIPAVVVAVAVVIGYSYLHRWMHRKMRPPE